LLSAGTHGDFRWVATLEGKSSIGVDQVRVACEFVSKTAGYGTLKVLVVEEADKLTTAAANALLKTLEEPQGDTLIILMSRRPWLLPATVRSRCQSRKLPRLGEATCKAELAKQGLSSESYSEQTSRFLENWLVSALGGTLEAHREVRLALNKVLDQDLSARELTECLMKFELSEAVEAMVRGLEGRLANVDATGDGLSTLITLHRLIASLLQRLRGGATPAREVACYEIGVLTAGASENKINVVREGLHLMGVARI
jgi:DNA polymerase-3 subunit delta'